MTTKAEIRDALSFDKPAGWFASEGTKIVGTSGSSTKCPLGTYLRGLFPHACIEVGHMNITFHGNQSMLLSAKQRNFIYKVDKHNRKLNGKTAGRYWRKAHGVRT